MLKIERKHIWIDSKPIVFGKKVGKMEIFKYYPIQYSSMERSTVVVDRQRRIYLPKKFKERAGSKFFIVKIGEEIRLVPIPADPAKDLAKLGKKLPAKSISKFRNEISLEAKKVD
ncbi:MAG: hypothetical protein KGH61_01350 [Candidatus Micrarchaeota archaeon]|nr:hypothetical protein [Candidatus Micrarchaeota archaeon]MDE1847577.1 hypothetical protein [Candidatus Micrarchaeota archaeon]MDE1864294.1 hypothetical protein [Candidatus Micrarchaeota archaeon]